MFDIESYQEARTVQEALTFLATDSKAKLIAGGTDILLQIRHGHLPQAHLIGIRHIEELRQIAREENGDIRIGSAVTFDQLMRHQLIREHLSALAEAVSDVGGAQIRRMATIGGNICNGATSADSAPMLFALDAALELESLKGRRTLQISRFYQGPGKVALEQGEILTAIRISQVNYADTGAYYIKYAMRKAMDIATLGCAAACKVTDGRVVRDVRLAFGVAAPTPIRCSKAEALINGREYSPELAEEFGQAAQMEIQPRTSWRATREFRLHLARELSKEALTKAFIRAGGEL